MTEVTRIAQQTKFGGKTVLNGTTKGSIFNTAGGVATSGQLALQLGANKGDEITFAVDDSTFSALAGGDGDAYKKANGILLSAASSAREVINLMDSMIAKVDNTRSNLGALQNRLESTIRNQSNVAANQSDARSRIRDADFAEESANLSQQSVIQQAATSMLMQANTRPQLALSMLG